MPALSQPGVWAPPLKDIGSRCGRAQCRSACVVRPRGHLPHLPWSKRTFRGGCDAMRYAGWKMISAIFACTLTAAADVPLNKRPLPPRHDECAFCHLAKSRDFMPSVKKNEREHKIISAVHGGVEMSCNTCHDINRSNQLKSTPRFPADFSNSSPVCHTCHAEVFADWTRGVHGKRLGGWKNTKSQLQCIDCHDAHSVRFKPMESVAKPRKPDRK